MPSPLIHIGLHKTGTSWLQVHLFGNPGSGFWNAAPDTQKKRKSRAKFGSYFFYRAPGGNVLLEDDFDVEATRAALGVDRVPEGRCLFVSNERLSGHPMSNGIDRSWICDRLHATIPGARVLMVVREQRSMILSSYMQYLKYGGPRSIEGFLAPQNDTRVPSLDLRYWDYDRLAETYIRRFGRDNVLVLPFEMLRKDPQGFVARICGFAGVAPPQALPGTQRENASQDYFTGTALRLLSPLIRSSRGNGFAPALFGRRVGQAVHLGLQKYLGFLVPRALNEHVKRRLQARVEAAVGTSYQASNRRLEELTGLDLRPYGYALPEPGNRDA